MKKVLITGINGYIGTSFEEWVESTNTPIEIKKISMRTNEWKNRDFGEFDAILYLAGIAHADVGNVSEDEKKRYYDINAKLTEECAKKAKKEGIKQFIFFSSMIVYGESGKIGERKVITKETSPAPANFYGDSKLMAEEALKKLEDEHFRIAIVRPPMIYGKNSKGNYPLLVKAARKLPFFPNVRNERSMLYIGNLCKFLSCIIEREERGIFFPQNKEYVNTGEMVSYIGKAAGKKVYLTGIFNPALKLIGKMGGKYGKLVNKAFGNMAYDQSLSKYDFAYQIYDLEKSIDLIEVKQ